MAVHLLTREKQEQIKLKKLQQQLFSNDDDYQEQMSNVNQSDLKNLYKEILENIWYKLYMLQNYNVSMDMFKGSNLRWQSIVTYLTYIRAIYKGISYKKPFPRSLLQYIQGLMDSGTEPYPLPPGKKERSITIEQLIQSAILTPYQINYIFEPVGLTEDEVDTSSAWTQSISERESSDHHTHEFYTNICTSPLNNNFQIASRKNSNTLKTLFRL